MKIQILSVHLTLLIRIFHSYSYAKMYQKVQSESAKNQDFQVLLCRAQVI